MDTNKRLLLAFALSFLVLVAYNYMVPQKKINTDINKTQISNSNNGVNANSANSAPSVNSNAAPTTTKSPTVEVGSSSSKTIATIETKRYKLTIDELGRFNSAILKEKKYKDKDSKPIDILKNSPVKPLEIRFDDKSINNIAFKNSYTASSPTIDATTSQQSITLTQKLNDITIKKIITFYPEGNYNIKVELSKPTKYFMTPGFRPVVDKSMYMVVRGILFRDTKGILTTTEDTEKVENFNNVDLLAGVDRYYTTLFYSKAPYNIVLMPLGTTNHEEDPIAFVASESNLNLNGYLGAKEWKQLEQIDPKLTDIVEFGWFTFLAKPFFKVMITINDLVGNWGWAIILFTILVKIILFPLSYKGLMSMQRLKDLAPKMKELKEKYGKDPAKMSQQTMALYKKHGANPMGGCLPMLLQIPIFFALYRVLLNADELQGAPWVFWIKDLSIMDPTWILPILMGATMFLQQKITPNTMTDPMQQKIFMFLPVLMTAFFINFPAGLVLYWLTNNILTIAQQMYINKAYASYKEKQKAKAD